jgi:signal transduction histidine kinase
MMKFKHSIYRRIIATFLLFTVFLCVMFSFLLLAYAWVIEDNIFNRFVDNEAVFISKHYQKTSQIIEPRMRFMQLYNNWQELPADIAQQHIQAPDKIEFDLTTGGSLHVKVLTLGHSQYVLAADVSGFEVSKDYLPVISIWILALVLAISAIALYISLMVAKNAVGPLKRLTEKVSSSKNDNPLSNFSKSFPNNEIGYLAQTFENTFEHLQQILQRESDFTRDVSHELRTPTTILKNLMHSTSHQTSITLNKKESRQFCYAVSEMEQTITTLLALARQESLNVEKLSLLATIEDCVINHYELNDNENFTLEVQIDSQYKLVANKNLLKILINNLLSNAVRYSSGNWLNITFLDNILIFENASRPLLLTDPFKTNCKGENSEGIGQGLNLVKRVCTLFDWDVKHESTENNFKIKIRLNSEHN